MKIKGQYYPNSVFIADGVELLLNENELIDRIISGQIGFGTKIISGTLGREVTLGAKCIVMAHMTGEIFAGDNCTFGWESRIKGGIFGDNVTVGDHVMVGQNVKIGSLVQIGDKTTLFGHIVIGDYVIIGESCAIDNATIESESVLGNHTFTEGHPHIKAGTIAPNGSIISGDQDEEALIEVVSFG